MTILMRKRSQLATLLILAALLLVSCGQQKLKDGTYSIEVYATNDTHGRFFDSLYVDYKESLVHPYSLASVVTTIREAVDRKGKEGVVLIDVGDHLQGDNNAFYYNYIDTITPHVFSRIMNYLEYDAVVVGNHDVEPGHYVYDRVANELDMPYLAANAIDVRTNEPYFEPYTIVHKNGVKIAVIGMTNPNIPQWLAHDLWKNIEFKEIVPQLQYWVDKVRKKEKPHLVIAAMHAGLGKEDKDDIENPSRYIAKNVEGIDIVFAAHDHQVVAESYNNNGKEVWLLEGGSRGAAVSKATIELDVKEGKIVSKHIAGETIAMEGVEPDAEYMDAFREDFLTVKKFTNRPVGMLNNDIDSRDSYFGPSEYVDMVHTLQLNASGADISFVAPLSFNAQISNGMLNYQDLMDIYPYENQLYVMEMKGREIKDYLEYSYSKWVNPNPVENGHLLNIRIGKSGKARFNTPHYNFDSAAGIKYEVDITKSEGERVSIKSLANGDAFDMDAAYKVAITSYRASGGGYLVEEGAGIPKEEIESRIVEKLPDIRMLLYIQIVEDTFIDGLQLYQWKFVPEELATKLGEKDYKLLFE